MQRKMILQWVITITTVVPLMAQELPIDLKPVMVTANRQEENILRVPSHITIVTHEDIKRSGATNTGDVLRTQAGIWVTNTSGSSPTGFTIDARGFNNGGGNGSRMLILIDGREVNLVDSSNPDWASIPVDSIARIEIIRGSSAALYGDNAMAGVINIITKHGDASYISDASIKTGSYNFWKRSMSVSEGEGLFTYYLHGSHESTDGYRDNSEYRASNYVGNFNLRWSPSTTARLRSSYLTNERALPGALDPNEILLLGRNGSVTQGDKGRVKQGQIDLNFESTLNLNNWVEISGGQMLRNFDSRGTFPGTGASDLNTSSRSHAVSGKYRLTHKAGGLENRLLVGMDYVNEKVRADNFSDFLIFSFVQNEITSYRRRLQGFYVHEELSPHPSVVLNLSGRLDKSKFRFRRTTEDLLTSTTVQSSDHRSFRVWSPKAGLSYRASPATSLFVSWSRSFRFPSQNELVGTFGLNPDLDPERATTLEIGSQTVIENLHQIGVSIYTMKVKDEILLVPPAVGGSGFGTNQNVPAVKHEGIELSAKTHFGPLLKVNGHYAVTRTKIEKGPFKGSTLPITPKHSGSVTASLGWAKGWALSVTGRFVGKRYFGNDLGNVMDKLPSFSVFHLRLLYNGDWVETSFGINNLFDHEYDDFGAIGGNPIGSRVGVNPSPLRNYTGMVKLRF